ncbi:MAG: hypothetical protein JWP44_4884, partial [Mucilaginibacter sp.]|nr:hypothetical protein [Mucilaginibacter sp.]
MRNDWMVIGKVPGLHVTGCC